MTLQQMIALAATGESETLEFKETTGTRRETAVTLCAFLNQGGEQVLVGIPGGAERSNALRDRKGVVSMNTQVSVSKERLASFCRERGIKRLAVFGSALREDFGPDSDVDVLVEFEPDRTPGLLGVAGMELELSDLFSGRKVDLRTPEDLSPYFRQDVLDAAEVQYAQG